MTTQGPQADPQGQPACRGNFPVISWAFPDDSPMPFPHPWPLHRQQGPLFHPELSEQKISEENFPSPSNPSPQLLPEPSVPPQGMGRLQSIKVAWSHSMTHSRTIFLCLPPLFWTSPFSFSFGQSCGQRKELKEIPSLKTPAPNHTLPALAPFLCSTLCPIFLQTPSRLVYTHHLCLSASCSSICLLSPV